MPHLPLLSVTVALLALLTLAPLAARADGPPAVVVVIESAGPTLDASALRARISRAANVQALSLLDEGAAAAAHTLCLVVTAQRALLELRGARGGLHVRREVTRPSGRESAHWIADAAAALLREAPTDRWVVGSEVIDPFTDAIRGSSAPPSRMTEVIDPWQRGARGHPSEQGLRLGSPAPRSRRRPAAPGRR